MLRLITQLENHSTSDEREENDRRLIAQLLAVQGSAALYRDLFTPGHITASALLISKDGSRVLMNHHKFLNKWMSFGGHVDGEVNLLNAARREVIEESGIPDIQPVFETIFDVDIHAILANEKKGEPAHSHYDVRFLFQATGDEVFAVSDESTELRWCTAQEAMDLVQANNPESRMSRLLGKWQDWYESQASKGRQGIL